MSTDYEYRPVDRITVRSSVLKSVGYDHATATLEVEFARDGDVYRFFMVTQSTYDELMRAESIGTYFDRTIRHTVPFERIS